jgi:hypothetical protein
MRYFFLLIFSISAICAKAQVKMYVAPHPSSSYFNIDTTSIDNAINSISLLGTETTATDTVVSAIQDTSTENKQKIAVIDSVKIVPDSTQTIVASDSIKLLQIPVVQQDTIAIDTIPKNPDNISITNTTTYQSNILDAILSDIEIDSATISILVIENSSSKYLTISNSTVSQIIIRNSTISDILFESTTIGNLTIENSLISDFTTENSFIRNQTISTKKPTPKQVEKAPEIQVEEIEVPVQPNVECEIDE